MSTMPNISATSNAKAMDEMRKQMQRMVEEAAEASANEVGKLVNNASKVDKGSIEQSSGLVPECNDNYIQATILAAAFRALRDEYASAYMRVESIQADKALCHERLSAGAVRSDTEQASMERSLEYYDTLDQRLEEISSALEETVASYHAICERQFREDDARQQDTPSNDRRYTYMPQLRWIKKVDREANPKTCELDDDVQNAKRQATRFIEWNWNK